MAKSVDEEWVEKKLRSANDTMESVQTLSLWALNHKSQCEQIVAIWLKVLKSVESNQMVVMFYLCNEVLQTCKKRNAQVYKESFKNILTEAVSLVSEEKSVLSLKKILKVWSDRSVFDEIFIAELNKALSGESKSNKSDAISETSNVLKKKSDGKLDSPLPKRAKLGVQLSDFNLADFCLMLRSDAKQRTKLKEEMSRCSKYCVDIDETIETNDQKSYLETNTDKINELCQLYNDLDTHLNGKQHLSEYLDIAKQFYDGQIKEAKLVSLAYKNYSNRVTNLSKKLADRRHLLMLSEQAKQEEEEEEEEEEDEEDANNSNTPADDSMTKVHISRGSSNTATGDRIADLCNRFKSQGERMGIGGDFTKPQEKTDEDEEKLFTHLFLEDPAPNEDDTQHQLHHYGNNHTSSVAAAESSAGGCRRQSLDARLEMLGFSGFSTTTEDDGVKNKVARSSSFNENASCDTSSGQEQPKARVYENASGFASVETTIVTPFEPLPTPQPEFISPSPNNTPFKPHNYHILERSPLQKQQQQQQQLLYNPHLYISEVNPQLILQVNEDDEGRATPVQDEPPFVPEPLNTIDYHSSRSSKFSSYDKETSSRDRHKARIDDMFDDITKGSERLESSKRLRKGKDVSPRKSGRKRSHKDEERRHREKSYEGRRSKERRHDDRDKSYKDKSKEKRHDEREYYDSKEHSEHLKNRRKSRDSSRDAEKHSSSSQVKKSSSFYSSLSSSKKSDTSYSSKFSGRDCSPLSSKRSPSCSPIISSTSTANSGSASSKPPIKEYICNLPGNEIVMEGIYQAVERPDGYSEIYRLPSNVDPNQYTYEEVVYVYTEEEDGVPQLKQLSQSTAPTLTNTTIYSSAMHYLGSNANVPASHAQLTGTFPVATATSFPAVQQLPSTFSLATMSQPLVPVNVLPGIARPSLIQQPIIAPGRVPVQIPVPPHSQQTIYPFVQQPPPLLPSTVLLPSLPPAVPPPSLLTSQLKDSSPQAASLLGVPLVAQLPTSASGYPSSFPGISKVLPSPSQFCQGIGATVLLQRRLDENTLENASRSRVSQSQSIKPQTPSSARRTSNLTTIQLTDDVITPDKNTSTSSVLASNKLSQSNSSTYSYGTSETSIKGTTTPCQKSQDGGSVEKICNANISRENKDNHELKDFQTTQTPSVVSQVEISKQDQLPDSSSTGHIQQRQQPVAEGLLQLSGQRLGSQEPDSTRTGDDDDDCTSDNGSSDLEDFQDAVTFTAPLSVTCTSTHNYSTPRGQETNGQPGLLKRHQGDGGRIFLGGAVNRNRPLLTSIMTPTRLPLFPVNQLQQFGGTNLLHGTNFDPLRFGPISTMPLRLPIAPPFVRIPINIPVNRLNLQMNPRF